jgi:outer membrane protein OmpA-like peptidoglycan-associated protein
MPKSDLEKGCVSCLVGTIHFPFDSAEITEKERSRLDELIRSIPGGGVVNLGGYTCDLGATSHNMGLSLRRARGVASYLKGKGISVGKVEGLGKCCPVSADKRLNRRVEISTQQKEEK